MRVGIPQALLYYQYYPMWKTFFEHLGAEVLTSKETTKAMMVTGSSCMVAETCLPTKVFCGHVIELAEQVDVVFAPSIRSLETNVYNCSKFLGLPDLVRSTVKKAPTIIDIEIDVNKGPKKVREEIQLLGKHFTRKSSDIDRAWERAQAADAAYKRLLHSGLTPPEAIARLENAGGDPGPLLRDSAHADLTVAVVGHPYNIYDGYINHKLVERLGKMGARVVTAEMAAEGALDAGTARLVGKPYWTFEDEVVGAAGHYLYQGADGVLCVVSFGCGPDSLMVDVIQRAAKVHGQVPLAIITIDEHTGEAGLVTRLEAFVDMLRRRRAKRSAAAQKTEDEGQRPET